MQWELEAYLELVDRESARAPARFAPLGDGEVPSVVCRIANTRRRGSTACRSARSRGCCRTTRLRTRSGRFGARGRCDRRLLERLGPPPVTGPAGIGARAGAARSSSPARGAPRAPAAPGRPRCLGAAAVDGSTVVRVGDRNDVGASLGVTPDPADDFPSEYLFDLVVIELTQHGHASPREPRPPAAAARANRVRAWRSAPTGRSPSGPQRRGVGRRRSVRSSP